MAVLTWVPANGLVVSTADQLLPPSACLIADNADMRGTGTVRKLPGYDLVSREARDPALDPIEPFQVAYRGDELIAFDDRRFFASRAEFDNKWTEIDNYEGADLQLDVIAAKRGDQSQGTGALIGDLILSAWQEETSVGVFDIFFAIQNVETKTVLVSSTSLGANAGAIVNPIVVAMDDWWLIQWFEVGTTSVAYSIVTLADFENQSTPVSWGDATLGFDAYADDDNSAILCRIDAAGTGLFFRRVFSGGGFTNSPVQALPNTSVNGGSPRIEAIPSSDLYLFFHITTSDTIQIRTVQPNLTILGGSPVGNSPIIANSPTFQVVSVENPNFIIFVTEPEPTTIEYERRIRRFLGLSLNLSPALTELTAIENAEVVSRPFDVDSRTYMWFRAPAVRSLTQTYLLQYVEEDTLEPVIARAWENDRASLTIGQPSYTSVIGTTAKTPLSFRTRIPDPTPVAGRSETFVDVGLGLATLDLEIKPRSVCETANTLIQSGAGFLRAYDGTTQYEVDWHCLPEVSTVVIPGLIDPGTYSYAVFWQWEDTSGRLHQSAPTVFDITLGALSAVIFTIFGDPHTNRNNLTIGIARTLDGASSVFYMITDPGITSGPTPGTQLVLQDNSPDSVIQDNEIYSQAGAAPELPNTPTPAANFVACLEDRLWFGDPEFPSLIRFSKPIQLGFGIGLTLENFIAFNTREKLTAIASQDQTFYGFTEFSVFFWTGDGPDVNGNGGSFSTPRGFATPIGVDDQRKVTSTPAGVFYGSTQGPRTIGRDRSASSPFSQVNSLFEYNGQTISTLLYNPQREETQVFSPEPESLLGPVSQPPRTLRYSHGSSRWSTESFAQATDSAISTSGDIVFLRNDQEICQFDESIFTRDVHRASLLVGTSWMKVGLSKPFQLTSVVLHGRFLSSHNLRIGIATDYDDALKAVIVIDPEREGVRIVPPWAGPPPESWSGSLALGDANQLQEWGWGVSAIVNNDGNTAPITRYQFKLTGPQSMFWSIRFVVWDITDGVTGTGESYALTAIEAAVTPQDPEQSVIDERLEY